MSEDKFFDYGDVQLLVKTHKEGYRCIVEIEKLVLTFEPCDDREETKNETDN